MSCDEESGSVEGSYLRGHALMPDFVNSGVWESMRGDKSLTTEAMYIPDTFLGL